MQLLTATGGVAGTNCYLVADEAAKQAVIFDAPDHTVDELLVHAKTRAYEVIGLWLTHGHFDHMADHAVVTGSYPKARVLIHKEDEAKLQNPGVQTRMFILPFVIPPGRADAYVEDGQKLLIGSIEVEVIHTPGHAPGHVMYHLPKQKVLIGGDLIICGAVGRTDLPDSDEDALVESIRKVYRLVPEETRLLPGHCEATTLADERRSNPYVRAILRG